MVWVAASANSPDAQKARLYRAGQAAAAAGQWPQALAQFRALVALDASYRDAPQRLADALDHSLVPIPAGVFRMGSRSGPANEQPQRLITLDAFRLDQYEVTNVQYQRYLKATGAKAPAYWAGDAYPPGQADYPVVGVGWADADAYCTWAGQRLPTEAEWEKGCRGAEGAVYPWGDAWDPQRANVDLRPGEASPTAWDAAWQLLAGTPAPGLPALRPVGSYPSGASPYGVMDMAGNASEWVWDWYNWKGYQDLPSANPRSLGPPWNRCLRGSSWYDPYGPPADAPEQSRCAARNSSHTSNDPRAGFRCAASAP